MSASPKVSVLMPAYNAEKYIGEAIESILNQTFKDFEFIIIDDCSTDNTWGIIQKYAEKDNRIVILRNEKNSKIPKTLNRGLSISRGKYIARVDADDWSYPYRLDKQINFMESHPEVGVSGGNMEVCDETMNKIGLRRYNLDDGKIRKKIFRYSPFSHPLIIFRADVAQNLRGYNEDLSDAEDYDLYFRIGRYYKFSNLDDILLKYRVTKNSFSHSRVKKQELVTLYVRLKAIKEYGYKMEFGDIIYFIFQLVGIFLTPGSVKVWLFNFFRNES